MKEMLNTGECGRYECEALRAVTGEIVRPGGYELTRKAVDYCELQAGSRLLDVGCGTGGSVEFLIKEYRLAAKGIDPSVKMLELGTKRWAGLPVSQGRAESINLGAQSLDAILTECSFSHFEDIGQALREFSRVLVNAGWLIISDLYIRRGNDQQDQGMKAGVYGLFKEIEHIIGILNEYGFEVVLLEDHTEKLKKLSIDLIMKYGSLERFWKLDCQSCTKCVLKEVKKNSRLGYYLLIARKGAAL
jgi:arsenite methyltransferase